MELGRNCLYFLHFLDLNFKKEKCSALDYGCGNGDFIKYANKNGYNFRGVDNYYDATNIEAFHNSSMKGCIDIIDVSGMLPFKDKTIDYITSIQVFEHVENLETVLNEMNRVLKENGKILCSFPFKYSILEGHYGIPFSHWFKPTSSIRKLWVLQFYRLGFGDGRKENLSFDEWYNQAFSFIDNFCHYRTKNEFFNCCRKASFTVHNRDKEGLQFRLQKKKGHYLKIMHVIIKLLPSWMVSFLLQARGSAVIEIIKTTHNK